MTVTIMNHEKPGKKAPSEVWLIIGTILAIALWIIVYWQLQSFSVWVVSILPIPHGGHLDEALAFFVFDTPKVLMLLALVVFGMGVVRSYFSPDRTRAFLAGKREGLGNIAAASLGVVTPFCSCSAVPLFVGFVSAGVPLGVTFSFLIASPMINEVALGLLFAMISWQVALTYLAFGLVVAISAGWIIGRLHLEGWLEPWVREIRGSTVAAEAKGMSMAERIHAGIDAMRDIFGRVWMWIIAGITAGAFIHGYVPTEMLSGLMGRDHWWSVLMVVLIGVPIYSNAAGIFPVILALLGKGAALGTVLAFMMSVTALSAPEMVILRKVLSLRLITIYIAVVAVGIIAVGYIFNALFS
jgi:uncharacterized membrane protein YraQ (UPF0718 family)